METIFEVLKMLGIVVSMWTLLSILVIGPFAIRNYVRSFMIDRMKKKLYGDE